MKEERNGDGSEWNQDSDMRFRLWLHAMNILMGEAVRWAKKTGNVWLEVFEGVQAFCTTGSVV